MREKNCIVTDGCLLMNKSPTTMCLAKKQLRKQNKQTNRTSQISCALIFSQNTGSQLCWRSFFFFFFLSFFLFFFFFFFFFFFSCIIVKDECMFFPSKLICLAKSENWNAHSRASSSSASAINKQFLNRSQQTAMDTSAKSQFVVWEADMHL